MSQDLPIGKIGPRFQSSPLGLAIKSDGDLIGEIASQLPAEHGVGLLNISAEETAIWINNLKTMQIRALAQQYDIPDLVQYDNEFDPTRDLRFSNLISGPNFNMGKPNETFSYIRYLKEPEEYANTRLVLRDSDTVQQQFEVFLHNFDDHALKITNTIELSSIGLLIDLKVIRTSEGEPIVQIFSTNSNPLFDPEVDPELLNTFALYNPQFEREAVRNINLLFDPNIQNLLTGEGHNFVLNQQLWLFKPDQNQFQKVFVFHKFSPPTDVVGVWSPETIKKIATEGMFQSIILTYDYDDAKVPTEALVISSIGTAHHMLSRNYYLDTPAIDGLPLGGICHVEQGFRSHFELVTTILEEKLRENQEHQKTVTLFRQQARNQKFEQEENS